MLTDPPPQMIWSDTSKSCSLPPCPLSPPGVEAGPVPISGIGTHSFPTLFFCHLWAGTTPLTFYHHSISRVVRYPKISGAGTHSLKHFIVLAHLCLHSASVANSTLNAGVSRPGARRRAGLGSQKELEPGCKATVMV